MKNNIIGSFKFEYMIQKITLLLFTTLFLWGCTRDDICPDDTQTTPLLVIKFMDISNPTQVKAVDNLRITLANTSQTEVVPATTDTLYKIPLNPIATSVDYNFTKGYEGTEPNTDAFNITYQRGADIYINRACGFRTSFIDIDPTIQAEGSANWMLGNTINNTTVENEDITHITIFH
ncbi:MAG TPA: hypothetical protein DCL52_02030 [Flavobacteriaceae bacterium]|nr:hypothetical protein [Flavobacteriaceae bacterium]